jgi:hypothetical protein
MEDVDAELCMPATCHHAIPLVAARLVMIFGFAVAFGCGGCRCQLGYGDRVFVCIKSQ